VIRGLNKVIKNNKQSDNHSFKLVIRFNIKSDNISDKVVLVASDIVSDKEVLYL